MEDKTKKEEVMDGEALSDDDLDQVAGGAGLRRTVRVDTVDISEDTKSKI